MICRINSKENVEELPNSCKYSGNCMFNSDNEIDEFAEAMGNYDESYIFAEVCFVEDVENCEGYQFYEETEEMFYILNWIT